MRCTLIGNPNGIWDKSTYPVQVDFWVASATLSAKGIWVSTLLLGIDLLKLV